MTFPISRRSLLKLGGIGAGAAIGARLAGPSWVRNAFAANEKSALLLIFCGGGYNQMFTSADSCLGRFGVTSEEIETIGNGLAIHKPTFGTLSSFTKQHMAAIGADVPGNNDHAKSVQMQIVDPNGVPWVTRLASAMGGEGAIKAAALGFSGIEKAQPVNGVSVQYISSLGSLIPQIPGIGAPPPYDPKKPDREIASAANKAILRMSKAQLDENPRSLIALREGYGTAQLLYDRVPKPVDLADIKQAYGVMGTEDVGTYRVRDIQAKFAAAEMLIRTGTNVVLVDAGEDYDRARSFLWTFDSHAPGGTKGLHERHLMSFILPGLRTFTSRMLEDPSFNVVVAFIGDFARSDGRVTNGDETSNGHSTILSASVMGKYVKTGTTGRTYLKNPNIPTREERFIGDTPPGNIQNMWAYFADVLKVSSNPFGANPHRLVL